MGPPEAQRRVCQGVRRQARSEVPVERPQAAGEGPHERHDVRVGQAQGRARSEARFRARMRCEGARCCELVIQRRLLGRALHAQARGGG